MFFLQFLKHLKEFSVIENVGLDDVFDRMNFQGNVILLLLLMSFVTLRQYFYSPISCFISSRVGGRNPDKYIQNMCWTEGLYPINRSRTIPQHGRDWDDLENQHLEYYAWIPLLLGLQAVLYLLPWILWQLVSFSISGINFVDIMKVARSAHLVISDIRRQQVQNIASGLFALLQIKGWLRRNCLFLSYMLIKISYIVINCAQLAFVYHLLAFGRKEGYMRFGERVMTDIMHGRTWAETLVFPRSGMCRFMFENLGAENYMFAQCSLPINMINEKIYIFLYFYFIVSIVLTSYSFFAWIIGFRVLKRFNGTLSSRVRLRSEKDEIYFQEFRDQFLGIDGCFIFKMFNSNVGSLMSEEIINCTFERFVAAKEGDKLGKS